MGFLKFERRKYKKTGMDLNLQRPISPKQPIPPKGQRGLRRLQARSAGCGRITKSASPAIPMTPKSSAKSDSTFCSYDAYNCRPSNLSYDPVEVFHGPMSKHPGDLDNDIHPIFQRSNCHGEARQRYDLLKPAFQVISRFLQTESLLPFWWTLFSSRVEKVEDPWYTSSDYRKSYEYVDVPERLGSSQIEQTELALQHLSSRIRLTVNPSEKIDAEVPGSSWTHIRKSTGDGRIFISRKHFRLLCCLINRPYHTKHTFYWFNLVSTLLHELAHAVVGVARPVADANGLHYFPDTIAAEDGFQCEKRLLGGVVQQQQLQDSVRIFTVIVKWPNANTIGGYLCCPGVFGVRERPNPEEVYAAEA